MTASLAGRTVVVVAADSGGPHIGRACALKFAKLGARVIAIDDSAESVEQTRQEVESIGGVVSGFVAGVRDLERLRAIAHEALGEAGQLHSLITAHMARGHGTVEGTDLAKWTSVLEANVLGPVASTKAFLPFLRAAGRASIVHIGSIDGIYGNPSMAAYSAAKGSLVPLTHVMANEFGPQGIRVNCIARAAVNGSNLHLPTLMAVTPLGRPCDASEVASVAAFLASDDASYISGAVLTVDGGRTGITPGTFLSATAEKK